MKQQLNLLSPLRLGLSLGTFLIVAFLGCLAFSFFATKSPNTVSLTGGGGGRFGSSADFPHAAKLKASTAATIHLSEPAG